MRKIRSILAAVLAVIMIACVPAMAAQSATVKKYPITLNFHETEARRSLDAINAYRADKDAWYWDQNNRFKIKASISNPKAMSYDYALEQVAMQRLAELIFSSVQKDQTKRPNGKDVSTLTVNGKKAEYEVLAQGVTSATAAVNQLKGNDKDYKSQPYRQLILHPSIQAVGVAYATIQGQQIWLFEFSTSKSTSPKTNPVNGKKTINVEVAKSQVPSLFDEYGTKQENGQIILTKNGKKYSEFTGFLPAGTGKDQQILYFKNGVFQSKANGKVTADYNGQKVTYNVKNGIVTK